MEIITGVLTAAIRSGTPLLLAAQGELVAEKSGVMNLGLEGLMLIGAIFGFMVSKISGSPWLGLLAAALAAMLFSLVHAVLAVTMRMNQVISGLAIVFLGIGLSTVIGAGFVGQSAPSFKPIPLGALSAIPLIGPALFNQDILVYGSMLLTPLLAFFIHKTRTGLSLRATGDSPQAADAAGIPVIRLRICAVAFGGMLCGLGGAYMSLCYTNMWQPAMLGGRGWIALALVIFSGWRPGRAMLGAYLFGGISALQLAMQVSGTSVSSYVLQMLPYLFTILTLSLAMWRAKLAGAGESSVGPASLGQPYFRE